MLDLKIQHILTLAELLSKGARYNFVHITTASLGKSIKKSQSIVNLQQLFNIYSTAKFLNKFE